MFFVIADLEEADIDKDGEVTFHEFVAFMRKGKQFVKHLDS